MSIIGRIAGICAILLRWFLGFGLALLLIAVIVQVGGRYLLNWTPAWAEVLSGLLLVWLTFLGAALAVRSDYNLRITLLPDKLAGIARKALVIVVAMATGAFAWVMLTAGIEQVQLTRASRILGMDLSSAWLYLSAPVSAAFMLVFLIEQVVAQIAKDEDGSRR